MNGGIVYACAPSIVWVRDADRVLVVDRDRERAWTLHGVESVAWDLLTAGYSYPHVIEMLSLLFSLPAGEAGRTLADVLRKWEGAGMVEVSEKVSDGEPGDQRGM